MAGTKISALTSYSNPDAANDVIPIVDTANSSTKKITRNAYLGLTSAPVGKDDTQTLTAKTLTAPTITSPILSGTITGTYTLAGTPTFPASVVTLTGSQTLTNKILTSPTISAPTITNASISADAITGFSSANNGTIYGVSVASSVITSAAVGTSAIVAAAVTSAKMQYGMIRQRQGGSSGDAAWNTTGTTNTDTSAKGVYIQVGTTTSSGGGAASITFPVAYTQAPIVFLTVVAGGNGFFAELDSAATTTGFSFTCWSATASLSAKVVQWMAVGQ